MTVFVQHLCNRANTPHPPWLAARSKIHKKFLIKGIGWHCFGGGCGARRHDRLFQVATIATSELPVDATTLDFGDEYSGYFVSAYDSHRAGYQLLNLSRNLTVTSLSNQAIKLTPQDAKLLPVAQELLITAIPSPNAHAISVVQYGATGKIWPMI